MLVSCYEPDKVWEQTQLVDACEWSVGEGLLYTMPVSDTVSWFNLLLDVRNRTDYPYSNLYLFITTEAPNGGFSVDTVQYTLAGEDGKWKGRGGFSSFKENRLPFRSRIRFPVTGDYTIKIRHGMREDLLKGIASIGVRLEK
jgi:gliding motility-associated lipoprotein GldH